MNKFIKLPPWAGKVGKCTGYAWGGGGGRRGCWSFNLTGTLVFWKIHHWTGTRKCLKYLWKSWRVNVMNKLKKHTGHQVACWEVFVQESVRPRPLGSVESHCCGADCAYVMVESGATVSRTVITSSKYGIKPQIKTTFEIFEVMNCDLRGFENCIV